MAEGRRRRRSLRSRLRRRLRRMLGAGGAASTAGLVALALAAGVLAAAAGLYMTGGFRDSIYDRPIAGEPDHLASGRADGAAAGGTRNSPNPQAGPNEEHELETGGNPSSSGEAGPIAEGRNDGLLDDVADFLRGLPLPPYGGGSGSPQEEAGAPRETAPPRESGEELLSAEEVKGLERRVSWSDQITALRILSGAFTLSELNQLRRDLSDGVSAQERRKVSALLKERLDPQEIERLKNLAWKYADLVGG